jgi:hypothetical protein
MSIMPGPPELRSPAHHRCTVGSRAWHIATNMRALAKPAAKLLTFGFKLGRYRKPDPAE